MNQTNAIEVYVISGFLGAGKTSFMQEFLTHFSDKKLGVLVNELGAVNIDSDLLPQEDIHMEEITSGSIYCYCKQGDFVKVLKLYSKTEIDVLIIENSGIGDPSNLHSLLIQGEECRSFDYKGGICLVDAMTFPHHVQVLPAVENQVKASSILLLNKVDMVSQAQVALCKEELRKRNATAVLQETIHGHIPFSVLESSLMDNGFSGETTNKCYNKYSSYALECEFPIEKAVLLEFVQRIKERLYRIKGFVFDGTSWNLLDTVGNQVVFREISLEKRQKIQNTKLVFIGKDEIPFRDELYSLWQEVIGKAVTVYAQEEGV